MVLLLAMILLPAAAGAAMLIVDPKAPAERSRWAALLAASGSMLLSWVVAATYWDDCTHPARKNSPIQPSVSWSIPWLEFSRPRATVAPPTEQPPADAETPDPQPPSPELPEAVPFTAGTPAPSDAPNWRLEFRLGLDGVSLSLVLLTTLLTFCAVLCSWETIQTRPVEFYLNLLLLETGLIGVFCAFDVLLFYVFFEFTLIPLYFLVGIWGGPQRRYAAYKFFLYTLAGSMMTLLGVIALCLSAYQTTGLATPFALEELSSALMTNPLPKTLQVTLFLAISAGFLIKVPVFPFHTWLPLAHVEAPTAGSVLLAGVLLKLGTYGFLRLCLPMLPEACVEIGQPMIAALAVVGVVYGSLCALAQRDMKRMVAYSSVAHLGFCMLGLFALNREGLTGAVLQMINHGLSTGALFLLVGMIYDRYHTRMLDDVGGLARRLPRIATALVFVSFASIGLPGLNGFVGEALCLAGMYRFSPYFAAAGLLGVVLGAWYLLGMLQTALFGSLKEPAGHHAGHGHASHGGHAHGGHVHDSHGHDDHGHGAHGHAPEPLGPGPSDMNVREWISVAPLMAACLWLGVFPQQAIDLIQHDIHGVARLYESQPLRLTQSISAADPETAR